MVGVDTRRLGVAVVLVMGCSRSPAPVTDVGVDVPVTNEPDLAASDDMAPVDVDAAAALVGASVRVGCNPLAHEHDCLLPYPSDFFRRGPAGEETVRLEDSSLPRDKFGAPIDAFFDQDRVDGFSVHPSILFHFGEGLAPESLVPQAEAEVSVTPASPTILLDVATGEPVPHFSEVYEGGGAELQLGAIRPLVRLKEGTRYVVAVSGVERVDGVAVEAPRVFTAFRDSLPVAPRLQQMRDDYEARVFAPLEQFGVDRGALSLAWDFTTRSRENLMGDMLDVRDRTIAWLADNEPTVTIGEVREGDDLGSALRGRTYRHVEGTFTAPLFTAVDGPGTPLSDIRPNGTIEVSFTLTIPLSVVEDPQRRPARFIQFGHGFFGRRTEVVSEVQARFGNDLGFVMGAVDWVGMTSADRDWVVNRISEDPTRAFDFAPRLHQAMANQLVFTEVVKTVLPEEPMVQIDSQPVYDPEQVYFYGISQGHILGGTFVALSPSIDRAVFGVGGASFGLILTRSFPFLLYERILAQWFEPLELLKFEALATTPLEVIDPIAYAPFVVSEPLPGSPARQVMLHMGLGDTAVPNVATELHARAIGVPLVIPSNAEVPFLGESSAPASSGLVAFDFGIENEADNWEPVNVDNAAHEGVRRYDAARQQIDRFLQPGGVIEDTCGGVCVVP